MKRPLNIDKNIVVRIVLGFSFAACVCGCQEANIAIDKVLGNGPAIVAKERLKAEASPSIIPIKQSLPGTPPLQETAKPSDSKKTLPAQQSGTESPVKPQAASENLLLEKQTAPTSTQDVEKPQLGTPLESDQPAQEAVKDKAKPAPTPAQNADQPGSPGSAKAKPGNLTTPAEKKAPTTPPIAKGKRRVPGSTPPRPGEDVGQPQEFVMGGRGDVFRPPTDEVPTECPPSRPLCKFDRSQLKLVGVIQVSDGNYKGMVEDPDGRGYYVTTGMMIGRATITQITNRGLILYDHRSNQDVPMNLAAEGMLSER